MWQFFRRHAVPMYRELTREGARSIRVDGLLTPASGRQDHATSPSAFSALVSRG
jgi:hypothetical protein